MGAARLMGEVKKRRFVNALHVTNAPISRPQDKFAAKIHQQADGFQNREVLSINSNETCQVWCPVSKKTTGFAPVVFTIWYFPTPLGALHIPRHNQNTYQGVLEGGA